MVGGGEVPATTDLAAIEAALKRVIDPRSGQDLVASGRLQGLAFEKGVVRFTLEASLAEARAGEALRQAAASAVAALPGVQRVTAVLTAHRASAAPRAEGGAHRAETAAPRAAPANLTPGIRQTIAVASGKGGVGKSTVAVNLALALSQLGHRVGLLDADVYGPSVPRLLGLTGRPSAAGGGKLAPMSAHGIVAMSMGLLIAEETPMIWRGPMVIGALEQMLRDVDWGTLDILVVDLPPGTGDIQLSLAQRARLAGAVIVSTPQDLALLDARKGLNMFRKVAVPILGLVENMSGFICPHCGGRSDIFGHGGVRDEAAKLACDFLGEVPLVMRVRETSDAGTPIVVAEPDNPAAQAFRAIAQRVADKLAQAGEPAAPRIVMS